MKCLSSEITLIVTVSKLSFSICTSLTHIQLRWNYLQFYAWSCFCKSACLKLKVDLQKMEIIPPYYHLYMQSQIEHGCVQFRIVFILFKHIACSVYINTFYWSRTLLPKFSIHSVKNKRTRCSSDVTFPSNRSHIYTQTPTYFYKSTARDYHHWEC